MAWIEKGRPRRVCWVGPDKVRETFTFDDEDDANIAVAVLKKNNDSLSVAEVYEKVTGKKLPKAMKSSSPTLREWVDDWLATKQRISAGTKNTYRRQLDKEILPVLGDLPLDEIDGPDIARFLDGLKARGLQKTTRTRYYAVLHAALRAAQKRKKVADNAAQWVEFDRNKPDKDDTRTEDDIRVYLTVAQYHQILTKVKPHYRPFVMFLAETGARFSEGTALRVMDFDYETRTVHIRRAWSKGMAAGVRDKAELPKSGKQRSFQVSQALADLLKKQSSGRDETELIFRSPRGAVIHQNNFHNRYWIPAVTAAMRCEEHPPPNPKAVSKCGCSTYVGTKRRATPHHLRHSYASWMLTAGWSLEKIAKQLGHTSTQITEKTYARFLQKTDYQMADTMDELMGRTTQKDEPDEPGSGVLAA